MRIKRLLASFTASLLMILGVPMAAMAATTVVTPTNTQGWSTADTRPGGAVHFISDNTSPLPVGALQLTTDSTTTSKAQYLHAANTPIAQVTELGYSTKQISGPAHAAASYQLLVDLNGATAGGFTTLVYEPYQNGTVTPGIWQTWDVDAGQFWSSQTVTCSNGAVTAGGGGAPFYNLSQIKTLCPEFVVIGYGVNVGSNNPSYNVEVDKFIFNGTTFNFEPIVAPPSAAAQCRDGGWRTFNNPSFSSRDDCLDYVEDHNREVEGEIKYSAGGLNRSAEFEMNTEDNRGIFRYSDANGDWYRVRLSEVRVSGNTAYFAGEVMNASNPAWIGQWLFAKVEDGRPDKIWGDFTDETTARNGVINMTSPASGPFNITGGSLEIED